MNSKLLFLLVLLCLTLANKSNLFLLKTYGKNLDMIIWVMSEKLDDIRWFLYGKKLIN